MLYTSSSLHPYIIHHPSALVLSLTYTTPHKPTSSLTPYTSPIYIRAHASPSSEPTPARSLCTHNTMHHYAFSIAPRSETRRLRSFLPSLRPPCSAHLRRRAATSGPRVCGARRGACGETRCRLNTQAPTCCVAVQAAGVGFDSIARSEPKPESRCLAAGFLARAAAQLLRICLLRWPGGGLCLRSGNTGPLALCPGGASCLGSSAAGAVGGASCPGGGLCSWGHGLGAWSGGPLGGSLEGVRLGSPFCVYMLYSKHARARASTPKGHFAPNQPL